jgi:hypothetical protein
MDFRAESRFGQQIPDRMGAFGELLSTRADGWNGNQAAELFLRLQQMVL